MLSIALITHVSAIEWGGLFTEDFKVSTSKFSTSDMGFKQSNGISLWMNAPITEDGNTYFATQGSTKYYFDFGNENLLFTPLFDVELVKLAGRVNILQSQLAYSLGRFSISDLTGKIFSQMCDGALVKFTLPAFEVSAYAGYTGFLNGLTVSMLGPDKMPEAVEGSLYGKAHSYIPAFISLEMPYLFLNQTFNAQVSAFIDMEETEYNRVYGTFSLYGPIFGPLYYSVLTTLGIENFESISNYSCLSLQMFISSAITIKINGEYASGQNAIFSPFVTVTSSPAYNSLESPELSGLILPNVDFILTTGNLFIGINGKLVMGIPEDEIIIQGANFNLSFIYNIFSDLQLGVSGIYYNDINTSGAQDNLAVNINVSISF